MVVDLGFVEKCDPWRLESKFFPSKVGGKPAWLDLQDIPGEKELQCDYCQSVCIFLCQVYAPIEENPSAFHRTIYIFVCKNVNCCKTNESGNFKVFRSQLERFNKFYPSEPPIEEQDWGSDISINKWIKTCLVCGALGSSRCSACKTTNYCCRAHQIRDWKSHHKKTCGTKCQIETNSDILFPEYELVIAREEDNVIESIDKDDVETESIQIEKYNSMLKDGSAGTFQTEEVDKDLQAMAYEGDETFATFQCIVKENPDQVLRYNRGGKILYISQYNGEHNIPKCETCNENRQFEFQIMPQLLNFLNLDSIQSIDWGVLAIFTCKKSCMPESGYLQEYLWKQDVSTNNESDET